MLGWLVAWPAQTSHANAHRCWNWFDRDNQHRDSGEAGQISGITQEIMQDYAVDSRRIFVAGLSAGGAAASIMGQTYPDLFAAIGVHSGIACGAASDLTSAIMAMREGVATRTCEAGSAIPAIIFQGDQDRTVNPLNSRFVAAQSGHGALLRRQAQRLSGTGYPCTRILYREARGRVLIEEWLVHGGGHAWFGGNPAGSFADPNGAGRDAGDAAIFRRAWAGRGVARCFGARFTRSDVPASRDLAPDTVVLERDSRALTCPPRAISLLTQLFWSEFTRSDVPASRDLAPIQLFGARFTRSDVPASHDLAPETVVLERDSRALTCPPRTISLLKQLFWSEIHAL